MSSPSEKAYEELGAVADELAEALYCVENLGKDLRPALERLEKLRAGGPSESEREVTTASARALAQDPHDPALGLDRSVCLRDVVTAIRERPSKDPYGRSVIRGTADYIARTFGVLGEVAIEQDSQ